MWRLESPLSQPPSDLDVFLDVLNKQDDFFRSDTLLLFSRAPGRLDVMGGIADYSGSLVLELPLSVACYVAAQHDTEHVFTVRSTNAEHSEVSIPMSELLGDGAPDYERAHALLSADPARAWAAYVAGTLVVLARERGIRPNHGVRIFVHSSVPAGAGVSSSAALEVATMQALSAMFGVELDGREIALLCQLAENMVVGAPCGVMDQMTSALGEQNRLLCLLCQPAEVQPPVQLPPSLEVWGIDSGIQHAVSGADYGAVRTGAFMGYRIVAELAGLRTVPTGEGRVAIEDPAWGGYLANIGPSEWVWKFQNHLPESMTGEDFLSRYGGITDSVTRVDPERTYRIRQPTAHPIYENHRVMLYRALLTRARLEDEDLRLLGELMYQSHASYSACGLGSKGTDLLVEMVREAGTSSGLWGAKITGGGSGGTVAILAGRGRQDEVERIAAWYRHESGAPGSLLGGTSHGAAQFGVANMVPT